jgi:hypothetical protein
LCGITCTKNPGKKKSFHTSCFCSIKAVKRYKKEKVTVAYELNNCPHFYRHVSDAPLLLVWSNHTTKINKS